MHKEDAVDEIEELSGKISKRFREVREWREMKILKAAVLIGISPRRLGRIEENKSLITISILFKAAKVYEVELDVLLCRKDIPRGGGKRIKLKGGLMPHPATS